jgi:DNA replication protein DnaC
MSNHEAIAAELKQVLRRLRLSPILDTLPERLTLARQGTMAHQDFLLLVLSDEVERRDRQAATLRAQRATLDPSMQLDVWDDSARVSFDRQLWSELVSLRFVDEHHHVLILGPVGVGKTFLATTLGHIACRRGLSVLMFRTESLLKQLKACRLDASYERELRRLIRVDLLVLDDFCLDQLDAVESRDVYEIVLERHRAGSMIVTSNREPQEWLAMLSDPLRAQSAIDRLKNAAYELVIEGESYRVRQKPTISTDSSHAPLPGPPAPRVRRNPKAAR